MQCFSTCEVNPEAFAGVRDDRGRLLPPFCIDGNRCRFSRCDEFVRELGYSPPSLYLIAPDGSSFAHDNAVEIPACLVGCRLRDVTVLYLEFLTPYDNDYRRAVWLCSDGR
jgi:hypothetical protein